MSLSRLRSLFLVAPSGRVLLTLGILVALLFFSVPAEISAQETEAPAEPSTEQPAEKPTEIPLEPSSGSGTSKILADIMENKGVSAEKLRQLHIPDELIRTVSSEQQADVKFMNRHITRFRAQIMGSVPEARAQDANERIERQFEIRRVEPVDSIYFPQGVLIRVNEKTMFAISTADLDLVAGETLESRAEEAMANLEKAIKEAEALRSPEELARSVGWAVLITLVYAVWIWFLKKLGRLLRKRVMQATAGTLKKSVAGMIAKESDQMVKIIKYAGQVARVIGILLFLFSTYLWLTAVLKRFPYTRPWGEALGGYLLGVLTWIVSGVLAAIPGLFIIVVIYYLTRALSRMMTASFDAIEEGRLEVPGLDAEVAQPTKKLAVVALWLLAVVVAYPYFPGSGTDAFKGLSVFVGLVVSLGSTGVVNQAMSGFMLMYSRALRVGDWVHMGEVEGEVLQLGMLSTKVRTRDGEEVTVPNAVVISKETINYSRFAEEGVMIHTVVTIGYDTPWRQVHAMLEQAAAMTPGLRQDSPPFVLQTGLSDWYPEYTLKAVIDNPPDRPKVLSALHKNIQDIFNDYGVQIMSPHYINDPPEPFLVPPDQRSPAPATAEDSAENEPGDGSES
jgi:small-conductance mechanosensitive channel